MTFFIAFVSSWLTTLSVQRHAGNFKKALRDANERLRQLDQLKEGISLEGVNYGPVEATLDSQQGANVWLTVGLREGKNREIRRAMSHIGLTVNRLIRVSYGPFRLNEMEPGAVVEVKARVEVIGAYSAHADQKKLIRWVTGGKTPPLQTQ